MRRGSEETFCKRAHKAVGDYNLKPVTVKITPSCPRKEMWTIRSTVIERAASLPCQDFSRRPGLRRDDAKGTCIPVCGNTEYLIPGMITMDQYATVRTAHS